MSSDSLTINPHDLPGEACRQAANYAYHSGLAADAAVEFDHAEADLEGTEAELTTKYMTGKITITLAKCKARADPLYRAARKACTKALLDKKQTEGLARAWWQRGELLNGLLFHSRAEQDQLKLEDRVQKRFESRSEQDGKVSDT